MNIRKIIEKIASEIKEGFLLPDGYKNDREIKQIVNKLKDMPLEERAQLFNEISEVALRGRDPKELGSWFKGWGREDFNKLYKFYTGVNTAPKPRRWKTVK